MRHSNTRSNTFCAKSQNFWQACVARAEDWITWALLRRLHGQVQVGLASKSEGRILQCLPRGALPLFDLRLLTLKQSRDRVHSSALCHQECAGFGPTLKKKKKKKKYCAANSFIYIRYNGSIISYNITSPNPSAVLHYLKHTQYKWHYCKPTRSLTCCAKAFLSVISG